MVLCQAPNGGLSRSPLSVGAPLPCLRTCPSLDLHTAGTTGSCTSSRSSVFHTEAVACKTPTTFVLLPPLRKRWNARTIRPNNGLAGPNPGGETQLVICPFSTSAQHAPFEQARYVNDGDLARLSTRHTRIDPRTDLFNQAPPYIPPSWRQRG